MATEEEQDVLIAQRRGGSAFENVRIFQALIDLKHPETPVAAEHSGPKGYGASSLSSSKIFLQCCNLSELVMQDKNNHLMTNP